MGGMVFDVREIRAVILHNWRLKLLALVVALLTYYVVRSVTRYEVDYAVPVTVEVAGKGLAVLDQDPATVRVWFRGSQEDLLRLNYNALRAVVRAADEHPEGRQRIPIRPRDIEGVSGVAVVRLDKPVVEVTFDREVEILVPVARPTTVGTPLVGEAVVDVEPTTVVLRGPKRTLKDVKIVKTEPVDVEGRGAPFVRRVRVLPPGDSGVVQIDPPEVKAKVDIVTEMANRQWSNVTVVAVMAQGSLRDVMFEPPAVDVHLHGRADLLRDLAAADLMVYVDCSRVTATEPCQLPVAVHVSRGPDVNASVEPKTVRATFKTGPRPGG